MTTACPTGKTQYATTAEADKALQWARERTSAGKIAPVRIHYCLRCAFWHLTSRKFVEAPGRKKKLQQRRKR
jgi:hypothetical protein